MPVPRVMDALSEYHGQTILHCNFGLQPALVGNGRTRAGRRHGIVRIDLKSFAMKKYVMTFTLMLMGTICLLAQNPVPDPDTVQNPVQEGDPALRTLPPRLDYVDDRKRIQAEEVPAPVRETLESNAQYSNWQKATLYHDANKDEYIVEFQETGKPTSYRFSKEGKQIIEEK